MSKSNKVCLSVILTGYNEGSFLANNLEAVKNLLSNSKYSWEIILYDDGSSDRTPEIFSEFAKHNRNVKVFFHRKNLGRGKTVKDALKVAKGEIVGYIDTDLELSPVYIFEFVGEILNGSDMAIATRFYTVSASNIIRAVLSKGYIFLMHMILGLHFKDTEAGFKFFKRNKILPVIKKVKDDRWFFDTEIVARSYWEGLKIAEIPVVYMRNSEKKSSVNLIKVSLSYLTKLLAFRKNVINKRCE